METNCLEKGAHASGVPALNPRTRECFHAGSLSPFTPKVRITNTQEPDR
jgi:hypothetical protein